jgi:hypothetical protein
MNEVKRALTKCIDLTLCGDAPLKRIVGAIKSLGGFMTDRRGRVCTMFTSKGGASEQLGRSELIDDGRRWTLQGSD